MVRLEVKFGIELDMKAKAKAIDLVLIGLLAWMVTKEHPSKYYSSGGWLNS